MLVMISALRWVRQGDHFVFESSMAYRMTLSQKEKSKSVGLIIPGQKECCWLRQQRIPRALPFPLAWRARPGKEFSIDHSSILRTTLLLHMEKWRVEVYMVIFFVTAIKALK